MHNPIFIKKKQKLDYYTIEIKIKTIEKRIVTYKFSKSEKLSRGLGDRDLKLENILVDD